ncbi:tRNA uracil 4-sulfurtransferase ThiI [Scatolibacter rhodanostii]|uniref:tRNA uracil 4-sulfurtransferase ThiI n=1 Tax=Scatolibacter rhodanostii TaxID=2014781 RepID=UPI000C0681B1|nr:tRNA uracil 4-sulfurtransferase ThiI [Scatolibacter rhodanostii]
MEVILLKLGEIVLKGLNRRTFEDMLVKTVRRRLRHAGEFDVKTLQSTIYVVPKNEDSDMDMAENIVSKIFGIVGYARAGGCEKAIEEIQKRAAEYLRDDLESAATFKVETKRSDKKFPLQSPEVSNLVGGYLLEQYPHLTVDVRNPDFIVNVEVREDHAYVHTTPKKGAGGIPVGTGGRGAVLISGGLDSPVAAWTMAKRGVQLVPIHFSSPPYTSELAHRKVENLLRKVSGYAGRMQMISVEFTKLQEAIRDNCPGDLNTVILRRYMLRAAEKIAELEGCGALITGESLGQVASQTMQAIACTDAVVSMPVFRPLIGSDKSEIVKTAYQIDTYDISIEPYEDCCTIFTPKHPRTKPKLHHIEFAEKNFDGESLMMEAIENRKFIDISP